MQKQKGFTLIELLVVISVIGLLASVLLVAINNTRAKARDAKRIEDLKQVSTALELCYDKQNSYSINGETTLTSPCWRETLDDSDFVGSWGPRCGDILSKLPTKDPSGNNYTIHTTSDYQHYVLMTEMETSAYTQSSTTINNLVTSLGLGSWAYCSNYNYAIGH